MALFQTKTFLKYDDYMTDLKTWKSIIHLIPDNYKIWSPFYGDGEQKKHFKKLGYDIIHKEEDFFYYEPENYDIICDNPPFTLKKEILTRLKEINKPFIILCPSSMLNTVYLRNLFKNEELQILIPRRRIQFIKDGLETENRCNFDCFFYCYKLNLNKDITFLE